MSKRLQRNLSVGAYKHKLDWPFFTPYLTLCLSITKKAAEVTMLLSLPCWNLWESTEYRSAASIIQRKASKLEMRNFLTTSLIARGWAIVLFLFQHLPRNALLLSEIWIPYRSDSWLSHCGCYEPRQGTAKLTDTRCILPNEDGWVHSRDSKRKMTKTITTMTTTTRRRRGKQKYKMKKRRMSTR